MTRALPARSTRIRDRARAWAAQAAVLVLGVVALVLANGQALALKAIDVGDQDRIELTEQGELIDQRGDSIQIETAAGTDGMAGRMAVRSSSPGLSPNWIVFALRNISDKPIERWVTAERYTVIGSGIVWPDLDARRIEALTPSVGFLPERIKSDRADIFRITLDPGQTITYAAELSSDRFARIYLWKPVEYELKARDRQLFNGILLGITGVLGIFLTAVFAANHKPIFPSAALLTWCVLAYLCVDFGFWHKLFQLRPEDNAVYRAATESSMAASILVFVYIFLRLAAAPGFLRMLIGVWMVAQLALIAVAVIDPRLASTFARASFSGIAVFGMVVTGYLAVRGQDRALSLLPTWILFLVWVFAAGVTLTGRLSGDIVVSSLVAGLVLITVLVGFTVTQFAFRSLEPIYGVAPSEQQMRSLAIDGSGAALWEWNARREEIKVGPLIEAALGLNPGELSSKVDDFCTHLYPADRERFKLLLWSVQERGGGDVRIEIRMRHADNSYRWFDLQAAAVPSTDRHVLRCVGLMREVTDSKRAQERLLHDAVHDSLTGLPNRELFIDRLSVAFTRAQTETGVSPTVLLIDIDKFKSVNASFGLLVGDSLLLTLARRLQRTLEAQDTLARLGGNQFAILMLQGRQANDLAQLAERIRRSVRSPVKLAGQDIVLTGSIGIATWDDKVSSAEELLKEAEIAMYRAKRSGADRIEIFRAEMRSEIDDRVVIESDLRAAIEKRQLFVLYQPIIALATEELAGYEALVRWQHPRLGLLNPADFVPVAEESDLIVKLGSYVLSQAVEDAARWQKLLPRRERPLFVSVNVSTRQLFRSDLVQEIRHIAGRALVPPGVLRLEVTESLVMENPEKALEALETLRGAGAGLSLDDFGTGYSSLSYLHRFPFDTIKIDRDLVQSSTSEGSGSAIVRSIVALAHELGKKVVAEGVESENDVTVLRTIRCEYAQGYHYGEPMSERDVEKMLKVIRKSESRAQRTSFFRTAPKRKRDPEQRRTRRSDEATALAAETMNGGDTAEQGALRGTGGLRTRSRAAGSRSRTPAMPAEAAASAPAPSPMPPAPSELPSMQPQYPMPAPEAPTPPRISDILANASQAAAGFAFDARAQQPPYSNGTDHTAPPQQTAFPPSPYGMPAQEPSPPMPYDAPFAPAPPQQPSPPSSTGAYPGNGAGLHDSMGVPPTQPDPYPLPAEPHPQPHDPHAHQAPPQPQPAAPRVSRLPRRAPQQPDLSTLPPAIAASLAKLAKTNPPPGGQGQTAEPAGTADPGKRASGR